MSRLWRLQPNGRLQPGHLIDYGYVKGVAPSHEQAFVIPADAREAVFHGLPADLEYSVDITAWRAVDTEVDPTGRILSANAQAPSSPYQPEEEPVFTGTVTGVEPGADVTADAIPQLRSISGTIITIEQDSSGSPLAGQYPLSLSFLRTKGSFDVSAQQTLALSGFTGTCSASNVTVSGSVVSVASPAIGKFTVTSTKGDETILQLQIEIKAHVNNPPNNTSTSVFNSINSASDVTVTAELNMVATTTSIKATAVLAFFSAHPNGSSNIKLKARISSTSGSGYSDMGGAGFVTGTAETPPVPPDGKGGGGSDGGDGSITINQTQTGLTPGNTYYIIFVGQLTSGGMAAVQETGVASISAV